ncbi:transposase [Rhizobium sp. 57MFTsu3.2]|nr:transposase [Rhizobium sp. 57MFTsu3.2]
MKASKFSEAQIAFLLKQAEDGIPVGEVCRKVGISAATFYSSRGRSLKPPIERWQLVAAHDPASLSPDRKKIR